jgi:hypothetical protein
MRKKIIGSIFISMLVVIQAHSSPGIGREGLAWMFNQTIGYHAAFSNKVAHSIAYQGNIFLFNYGYSYQFDMGSKLYVGVSAFSLPFMFISNIGGPALYCPIDTRLQYGRGFSNDENLLRISFDYFFAPLNQYHSGIATYSTVGIFVEKNFEQNSPMLGLSFGISLNWSIWDIFIIKDKNQKYFRRYRW